MSIETFLSKENMNMLWELITSEDIFKFLTKENQSIVFRLFVENAKGFFETEKQKVHTLIDLNKKYIIIILQHIKKNYPSNKIKIYSDLETKEAITYEEIQNEKKTIFESEFTKKQEEFTNAMALPVPNKLDFSDKFTDVPITEMDKIIKEMTEKRNYDIENINRNQLEKAEQWLKPQKTSLKSEKFISNDVAEEKGKNVSWGENEEFYLPTMEETIFSKLKKIPSNLENITLTLKEEEKTPKSIEERLKHIEDTINTYHIKIDQIISLLEKKL